MGLLIPSLQPLAIPVMPEPMLYLINLPKLMEKSREGYEALIIPQQTAIYMYVKCSHLQCTTQGISVYSGEKKKKQTEDFITVQSFLSDL